MSKILITGDWHVKKGITTNIILNYLDYLLTYCIDNEIKDMFILGDIFDKSSSIKNEAFVPLFMKLYQIKNSGIKLTFILGNHDIYNVNNDSIVETFMTIGTVIKEGIEDKFNNYFFLPYTKKEELIPYNKFNGILFTHLPIADFSFDNSYHATEKHAFGKAFFSDFDLVFTGHFHRHQVQGNIIYPGSPIQLNFGETGQKKGFIVLDTSGNKSWEFIEYNKAPTYIKIDINDFQDFDPTNKFVSVIIDKKIENFIKLRKILLDKGAIEVRPEFKKNDNDDIVLDNTSFLENSSIKDMTKEYISKVKLDNIDTSKLLSIFENIKKELGE